MAAPAPACNRLLPRRPHNRRSRREISHPGRGDGLGGRSPGARGQGGGICYLDEIVEARKDTTVVIHPLADDRRMLPIEKRGEILKAPPEFMLAISYNPGYQSVLKDLKPSTRQRFAAVEFGYPVPAIEIEIVAREVAVRQPLSDDREMPSGLLEMIRVVF